MPKYVYITVGLVAFVLATISVMYVTAGTGEAGNILRVVNTTADHAYDGCDDLPGGDCTLREAITDVGSSGDVFEFDIPPDDPNCNGGVCTISPTTQLPDVTGSDYVIDGYTQPDTSANTNGTSQGLNTDLGIRIDGGDSIAIGFRILASNVTVRGLIITNFSTGIEIEGGGSNYIEGNFIGTGADGVTPEGNTVGVEIIDSLTNFIGGTTPAARNLISANTSSEMRIVAIDNLFLASGGNQILGNLISTDVSGTLGLTVGDQGIEVDNSSFNMIGGTSSSARNVVLGNPAINIDNGNATFNTVEGNYVGTDVTGSIHLNENNNAIGVDGGATGNRIGGSAAGAGNVISGNDGVFLGGPDNVVWGNLIGVSPGGSPLPSGGSGIAIGDDDNLVGGTAAAEGNIIAFNAGPGVRVQFGSNTGNRIIGNSIHSNGKIGIDLKASTQIAESVTDNDAGDGDSGANGLQNYPVITGLEPGEVFGVLDSTPNTTFRFEFFANDECDPSGFGEGQEFVGVDTIVSDGDGMITFEVSLMVVVAGGRYITATATREDTGDTSEFSSCFEVPLVATPTPTPTATPTPTPTPTATATPTATPEGQTPAPTPTGQTPTPTVTPTPGPIALSQGDNDCDGDQDVVDALAGLRYVGGLSVNQAAGCPALGSEVASFFGDIDCDDDVDAVDSLQILRFTAGLAVSQLSPCPDIGQPL